MSRDLNPLALYVHIPFCETKCPYCDFNTYSGIESMMPTYVEALSNEITQWGLFLQSPEVSTIFFGGGTPSYLPSASLSKLMSSIAFAFNVSDEAEVTLEANPGDLSVDRLIEMREMGFNRISIGVQSLDNQMLRILGRKHNAVEAKNAALAARQAGFNNLSLDLMFGLPHQSVEAWRQVLQETVDIGPDHLSLYGLTLEHGTPLEADVRLGRIPEPDPDLAADMYEFALQLLPEHDFVQYEISNWAKTGYQSIHNLAYWLSKPYLGVGPGAHSYLWGQDTIPKQKNGVRFSNTLSPRAYIQRTLNWQLVTSDALPSDIEFLGAVEQTDYIHASDAMRETMMMGLRLNEGVSDEAFSTRFGHAIGDVFPLALSECLEWGLIEWTNGKLCLTKFGRPLGNEVFQRFVTEPNMQIS